MNKAQKIIIAFALIMMAGVSIAAIMEKIYSSDYIYFLLSIAFTAAAFFILFGFKRKK